MTTEELLSLPSNTTLLVKNDSFEYKGRAEITLEGGEIEYWLFSDDGSFISVNTETDEMVFHRMAETEFESDEEGAVYDGEPYEFSYKDHGTITSVVDEAAFENDDVLDFNDFENDDGGRLRVLENNSTGDSQVYTGLVLVEEEIKVVED